MRKQKKSSASNIMKKITSCVLVSALLFTGFIMAIAQEETQAPVAPEPTPTATPEPAVTAEPVIAPEPDVPDVTEGPAETPELDAAEEASEAPEPGASEEPAEGKVPAAAEEPTEELEPDTQEEPAEEAEPDAQEEPAEEPGPEALGAPVAETPEEPADTEGPGVEALVPAVSLSGSSLHLYLYAQRDINSDILHVFDAADLVAVLGQDAEWIFVDFNGTQGYVAIFEPETGGPPAPSALSAEPEATQGPDATQEPDATEEPAEDGAFNLTVEPDATEGPDAAEEPDAGLEPAQEETLDLTVEPDVTQEPAAMLEPANPELTGQALEEDKTLLSETEITSYLISYYVDDAVCYSCEGEVGQPVDCISAPETPEGFAFSYWYAVDAALQGDPQTPYDFQTPLSGALHLMAYYAPVEMQTSEEPEAVPPQTLSLAPGLQVRLDGRELCAGEFSFTLYGPQGDILQEVTNLADGSLPFAPLTFTQEQCGGVYTYTVAQAQGGEDGMTYDSMQAVFTASVADDGQGALLVNLEEPGDLVFNNIFLDENPMVRVYCNESSGAVLSYGDVVTFSAELIDCGQAPRIQWQYSDDASNWRDITGANAETMTIQLTPSNSCGFWRVKIIITD